MRLERPNDPLACASYIRCQEQSEGNEFPQVQPSIPSDHAEQAASIDGKVARVSSALEAAAWHKAESERNWALFILALNRLYEAQGERAPRRATFTTFELDMARENAKAWTWNRHTNAAEYQS